MEQPLNARSIRLDFMARPVSAAERAVGGGGKR
jgi:hypothetical protein